MSEHDVNLNFLSKAVDTAVSNLTEEPTKSIGKTLSEIWYLTLGGPVHQAALKREARYAIEAEKFKEEIMQKIKAIPKEHQIDPDFQVVSTALDNAKFCLENEILRKMFANLIAAASNSTQASNTLPIFSDIIRKLSSKDALNLSKFKKTSTYPIAKYRVRLFELESDYDDFTENIVIFDEKDFNSNGQSESIDTLCSLGLVRVDYGRKFGEASYSVLFKSQQYNALIDLCKKLNELPAEDFPQNLTRNATVEVVCGIIKITDLGFKFLRTCMP